MTYFLYGLFFLSCIVLIVSVLLQPGKTDAGALFTSSVSSNAYGTRGTATVLSKTTIVAATVFMLSALMLAMPALNGNISVLSSNPEAASETPAAVNTNANVDANIPVNANVPAVNTATTNTATTNTATVTNTEASKPTEKKEVNANK